MIDALDYAVAPVKFKRFYFEYKHKEFNLLDVGCGYHSSSKTVSIFRRCNYYGIDRDLVENNEQDLRVMKRFFKKNLDVDSLTDIQDHFFDVVIFSHVIEHLHHGLDVLQALARKLKPGGVIYVEYPGLRSFSTPHAKKGCLHFCDDPTHIKLYMTHDVINALLDADMEIIKAGTRHDPIRILATPWFLLQGLFRRDAWSTGLWDLVGFADYVFARRRHAPAIAPQPGSIGPAALPQKQ